MVCDFRSGGIFPTIQRMTLDGDLFVLPLEAPAERNSPSSFIVNKAGEDEATSWDTKKVSVFQLRTPHLPNVFLFTLHLIEGIFFQLYGLMDPDYFCPFSLLHLKNDDGFSNPLPT